MNINDRHKYRMMLGGRIFYVSKIHYPELVALVSASKNLFERTSQGRLSGMVLTYGYKHLLLKQEKIMRDHCDN